MAMTDLTDDQMVNVTGGFVSPSVFNQCIEQARNQSDTIDDPLSYCCQKVGGDPRCNKTII